jgi:hypothetical protein
MMPRYYKGLPSVTSITACAMKEGLLYFYGKYGTQEAKRIGEEAAAIGDDTHTYINKFFTGKAGATLEIRSRLHLMRNPVNNFLLFNKRFKPKPILIEKEVVNKEDGYAGTLDGVMKLSRNRLVLLDWKVAGSIYDEYILQIEAYYRALTSMQKRGIIKIEGEIKDLWIVRFAKDGGMDFDKDILKLKPNDKRYQAFLGLKDYFNWKHAKENK